MFRVTSVRQTISSRDGIQHSACSRYSIVHLGDLGARERMFLSSGILA